MGILTEKGKRLSAFDSDAMIMAIITISLIYKWFSQFSNNRQNYIYAVK